MKGQDGRSAAALSQAQRESIEELVSMSPQVIKSRVRRDGISAATMFEAYIRAANLPTSSENNGHDLQSQH